MTSLKDHWAGGRQAYLFFSQQCLLGTGLGLYPKKVSRVGTSNTR